MMPRVEEKKKEHEEKLRIYLDKASELKGMLDASNPRDPLMSSLAVVEFGIAYEQMYVKWCESLTAKLSYPCEASNDEAK